MPTIPPSSPPSTATVHLRSPYSHLHDRVAAYDNRNKLEISSALNNMRTDPNAPRRLGAYPPRPPQIPLRSDINSATSYVTASNSGAYPPRPPQIPLRSDINSATSYVTTSSSGKQQERRDVFDDKEILLSVSSSSEKTSHKSPSLYPSTPSLEAQDPSALRSMPIPQHFSHQGYSLQTRSYPETRSYISSSGPAQFVLREERPNLPEQPEWPLPPFKAASSLRSESNFTKVTPEKIGQKNEPLNIDLLIEQQEEIIKDIKRKKYDLELVQAEIGMATAHMHWLVTRLNDVSSELTDPKIEPTLRKMETPLRQFEDLLKDPTNNEQIPTLLKYLSKYRAILEKLQTHEKQLAQIEKQLAAYYNRTT